MSSDSVKIDDGFCFVDDLDIQDKGTVSFEDTEESLKASLVDISSTIDDVRNELIVLKERLQHLEDSRNSILKKLECLEEKYKEILVGEPRFSRESSLMEKASFLYELFHGRRDVFAVRNWNEKTGKTSYYPHCINAWRSPECLLKKYRDRGSIGKRPNCMDCSIRKYEELTPHQIVNRQFRNRDNHGSGAIGIYPMLSGNTCRFVAIDLDEETWQNDALNIADVARIAGFQMAIERSFSGNGAHLWLFFSSDVPAIKARHLAFAFIDMACRRSMSVTLKSYDRIFPSQDKVGEGGIGNLILMPLVASAYTREGINGTVFVDNSFTPYPDQIAFLSSLPRYAEQDIDRFLVSTENGHEDSFWGQDDEIDVLWRTRLLKVGPKDALSSPLPVFLSAGISIPKAAMSARLQNALKRMACFANPEYFRAQRRNSGYAPLGLSSFVQSFIESESVLQLPRGLLGTFEGYMKSSGIEYRINDRRVSGTGLNVRFLGVLKEEQQPALDSLLESNTGILRAATSFGKTVVASALIAERKERTLILVPKQNLLEQWRASLDRFLVIENEPVKREGKRLNKKGIGVLGGSKDSISGYVDVATFQTVSSRMPEFIREYGMVIVDECHYVAADSLMKVMQNVRPKYVYGLSATVSRDDGLENLVYAQCGKVVFEYSADKLALKRGIVQMVVPRFTNTVISNIHGRRYDHSEVLKEIAESHIRNNLIVDDVENLVEKGRKVIVLTGRTEHARVLFEMLMGKGVRTVIMVGTLSREGKRKALDIVSHEDFDVIVATGKYMGEGTDIPCLDSLVLASPVAWDGVVSQYAGRIAREYSTKRQTFIYDYVDIGVPQLSRMYTKRLATYRKLGYVIQTGDDERARPCRGLYSGQSFFSQEDILEPFIASLRSAKKSIVISSPQLFVSSATKEICRELIEARNRGVVVEIRSCSLVHPINPAEQKEALNYISGLGLILYPMDDCYLRFAVIDGIEVWFGDINLLGGVIKKNRSVLATELKVMIHLYSSVSAASLIDSELMGI